MHETRLIGLVAVALGLVGCGADDGKRYPIAAAGQGYVALREEQVEPVRPVARVVEVPVERTGPTTREVELERKIQALEQKSKAMEDQSRELREQIDLLRREKSAK